MILFWLVFKLEISYKSYNNILKDFGFFLLEDFFLKIMYINCPLPIGP